MDVNVKVTVDLGDKTISLFNGIIGTNRAVDKVTNLPVEVPKPETKEESAPEEKPKAEAPKPVAEEPKAEPEKRTRRTKEQIAAEAAKTASGWEDMDDDARLEALKAEVTKHTKKGKSSDIKFLLSNFDAGRASELNPEDYDGFYEAITRYGKGESVEEIFPENLD